MKNSEEKEVQSKNSKPVILPLDVGYGFVKFGKKSADKGAEDLDYMSFASIAPLGNPIETNTMGIFDERDTVVVNVNGNYYEVGPDAIDIESSESARSLNEQYIFTEQYKALCYGAFHYMLENMESNVIDLLVVGLPSKSQNGAKLKELLEGEHKITNSETVIIKEVLVLSQPYGGFRYAISIEEYSHLASEYNLLIDPGFLTVDFLTSNGKKIIEKRSDMYPAGVSKILNNIAESISLQIGKKYTNINQIDKALASKKQVIKIAGVEYQLEEHKRSASNTIESAITQMRNVVGDFSDIENIILVGGGSYVFEKKLRQHFPTHNLIKLDLAQFANAKGFKLAGEEYYARRKK